MMTLKSTFAVYCVIGIAFSAYLLYKDQSCRDVFDEDEPLVMLLLIAVIALGWPSLWFIKDKHFDN